MSIYSGFRSEEGTTYPCKEIQQPTTGSEKQKRKDAKKNINNNNNNPESISVVFGNSLQIPLRLLYFARLVPPNFAKRCHLPFHGSEIPLHVLLAPDLRHT